MTETERLVAALHGAGVITSKQRVTVGELMDAEETCPRCKGSGVETCWSSSMNSDYPCKCSECNGRGKVKVIR